MDHIINGNGMFAIPGLIDFHTHLFKTGSGFGVNADLLFSTGVTTAVDMGSAGRANYEAFHVSDIIPRQMRIKTFLNISPIGQPGTGIIEPLTDDCFSSYDMEKMINKYRDEIVGLKLRISKNIVGELGLHPLETAVKLGEKWKLPVAVHTTNPPRRTEEIVKRLRPGDIYLHTFQGIGNTIIGDDDKVLPGIKQAQREGIVFEVGQGRMNFDSEVASKALEDGFYPNIISTDSTPRTLFIYEDMKNMPHMMSKFLNMGMPLQDVLQASLTKPAEVLGMENEIATLEPGTCADVVLFDLVLKDGREKIVPRVTIAAGKIVYCQTDFPIE
jgi:dihydroorotase